VGAVVSVLYFFGEGCQSCNSALFFLFHIPLWSPLSVFVPRLGAWQQYREKRGTSVQGNSREPGLTKHPTDLPELCETSQKLLKQWRFHSNPSRQELLGLGGGGHRSWPLRSTASSSRSSPTHRCCYIAPNQHSCAQLPPSTSQLPTLPCVLQDGPLRHCYHSRLPLARVVGWPDWRQAVDAVLLPWSPP